MKIIVCCLLLVFVSSGILYHYWIDTPQKIVLQEDITLWEDPFGQ